MTRRALAVTACIAALALAACGGGASAVPSPGDPGGAPGAAAPSAPSSPAVEAPATAGPTATTPPAASGPIDACALLTPEAVAAVVPEPTANSATDESGPVASYSCTWTTSVQGKIMALTVNVLAGYFSYLSDLGGDVDAVKSQFLATTNAPDEPGRVVDGLGDVAVAWLDDYYSQAHVRFLEGDAQVAFQYVGDSAQDAQDKLDAVVELARAAAGRLP